MERKRERLDSLFGECQELVLAQIIGPFGLSPAMFTDKAGGNVTTVHNFEQGIVANQNDQALHESRTQEYDRKRFELTQAEWTKERDERIARGVDEYTNERLSDRPELDHFTPIKEAATDAKLHLALGEVREGQVSVDKIKSLVNDEANLAITDITINRSKKDHDALEWTDKPSTIDEEKSNAERFSIDPEAVKRKHKESTEKFEREANIALLKKQGGELLTTGGKQALKMGIRQSLGVLLTELVNGLFTEFKIMFKEGFVFARSVIDEIRERLGRVAASVAKKLPEAFSALLEGGVSGFLSNLLTFVINSFVTTGGKLVRIVRDGLLGILKAFKIIAFPPPHLTRLEATQQGLKILTTVIVTSLGVLVEQSVMTFMASIPFLKPLADIVAPVLIGIVTGLASAFLAYQIDLMFDRFSDADEERLLDQMMDDARSREAFASAMVDQMDVSLRNVQNFAISVSLYRDVGMSLGNATNDANITLASLEATNAATKVQVERSAETIAFIEASQRDIELFLKGRA
jgi:hypothetical protein